MSANFERSHLPRVEEGSGKRILGFCSNIVQQVSWTCSFTASNVTVLLVFMLLSAGSDPRVESVNEYHEDHVVSNRKGTVP